MALSRHQNQPQPHTKKKKKKKQTQCQASTCAFANWPLPFQPAIRFSGKQDRRTIPPDWAFRRRLQSLVTAQWMAHLSSSSNKESSSLFANQTVLELGAGCGVPGLVVAKAAAAGGASAKAIFLTDFNPKTVANLQHNIELNGLREQQRESSESSLSLSNAAETVHVQAFVMNWQDESTWPEAVVANRVDVLIGSDLVYQSDMVQTLLQTVWKLRPRRFLYCAGADRCGHAEFIRGMLQQQQHSESESGDAAAAAAGRFELACPPSPAPAHYAQNPLASGDDEDCFVRFHELMVPSSSSSSNFTLYEFVWNEE